MIASFHRPFWVAVSALLFLVGCQDEEAAPSDSDVREVIQEVLPGLGGAGGAGACGAGDNGKLCDTDGDLCTIQTCVGTNCSAPDPGNVVDCTGSWPAVAATCQVPACEPTTGECTAAETAPDDYACASDGIACTDDVCDGGTCTHAEDNAFCNDSIGCTTDTCSSASGPGTGCTNAPSDAFCDDSESCTINTCNPAAAPGTGCEETNVIGPCPAGPGGPDAVACTEDICNSGVCDHNPIDSNCSDPNATDCQEAYCDITTDCSFRPLTTASPNPSTSYCDDQIDCTQFERCNAGTCVGTRTDSLCTGYAEECADSFCTGNSGTGCELRPSSKLDFVCGPPLGGSVCDLAEICDGLSPFCPTDQYASSSVECVPSSCSGGTQIDQVFCTGASPTCPASVPIDCDGHACDGGSPNQCLTSCSTNADCLSDFYCDTTTGDCLARLDPGGLCNADDNCGVGDVCVDGVCCNAPCAGQCEACNVTGFEGTCVAVPAGEAPHPGGTVGAARPACLSDGSTCGGACDGTNRSLCAYPPSGQQCAAADCNTTTNEAVEASTCNGAGSCITPTASDCAPYVCDGATCRGDCTQDSHCEGDLQCNGGVCVARFSNGQDCTVGSQCNSGLCVDGVCCDSTCGGQCEACNVAATRGTCSPVDGDPVGPRPACGGTGDCAGTCDGSNGSACSFPGRDQQCGEAECVNSTATLSAYCNGAGSCPAAQDVTCPDGCDGLLCANPECAVNADCSGDEVCRAGICVPPDPNGTTCSDSSDCESGNCVDGVCCDSVCGGQCEACDLAGSEGTCSPVPAGDSPRGGRTPCVDDGTICGGTCDGTTTDSCDYPTTGSCRTGDCADGIATVEASCNGTGLCPVLQQQDCGAGVSCDSGGTLCDGACATDPDACASGEYCSAGVCVNLIPSGSTCADDSQCNSGNCVDGYCCSSACDSQCAACDVPGSEGTCTPVEGTPHGARAACEGSGSCAARCDGEDVTECSFPGAARACGAAVCESGVETAPSACDGEGRCARGEQTACESLLCDGTECSNTCQTDEDCPGNELCDGGACVTDPLIDAVDKGSCGCRIPGERTPGKSGWPLALLTPLALLVLRRRKAARAKVSR